MALTAAQVEALTTSVVSLSEAVNALPVDDVGLQAELDGVNSRLDAVREQIAIALAIAAEQSYTDEYKLQMIVATLGPQT